MQKLGRLPKPDDLLAYDYMQLNRFLPIGTLKDLESDKTFTSAYTKLVGTKLTGDLQRVL